MKNIYYIFIIFIVSCLFQIAEAQNKTSIAILTIQGNGISPSEAEVLTDELRSILVKSVNYNVIERNNMEAILNEQGFQMSGCTSTDCAVEAGKLLGVHKMIAGSVGKLGELYNISIRIIDVETGKIDNTVSKRHEGSIEKLLDVINRAGYELSTISEQSSQEKRNSNFYKNDSEYQFGIKTGMTITETTQHDGSKAGIIAGGLFKYHFYYNLYFQPELLYATKIFEYYDASEKISYENLQIAILFSYNAQIIERSLFLNVNAGPAYNYVFGAQKEVDGETYDLTNYDDGETIESRVKSSEIAFVFGPGFAYRIGEIMLLFDFRYEIGFTEIFKDEDYWQVGKNRVTIFTAGIAF